MEKFFLKFLSLLSLSTLVACSAAEPEVTSGIDSNTIVSGSFNTYDASKIEGTGTIFFVQNLAISSSRALFLTGSLDNTIASSSITAVFYSQNSAIPSTDGVTVSFIRSGASVNAQIGINGNSSMVNSSKLIYYFPSSLDLIVEVHNVNSQARVLIWRRNSLDYTPQSADVDTARQGDLVSSLPVQTGSGPYAGLIIQNSTVTTAHLDTQKVQD